MIKQRALGFSEAQFCESVVVIQTIGGQCVEDINLFRDDRCLQRQLGHKPPRATALRELLAAFHDALREAKRLPGEAACLYHALKAMR